MPIIAMLMNVELINGAMPVPLYTMEQLPCHIEFLFANEKTYAEFTKNFPSMCKTCAWLLEREINVQRECASCRMWKGKLLLSPEGPAALVSAWPMHSLMRE
jgi:hypothetical protein